MLGFVHNLRKVEYTCGRAVLPGWEVWFWCRGPGIRAMASVRLDCVVAMPALSLLLAVTVVAALVQDPFLSYPPDYAEEDGVSEYYDDYRNPGGEVAVQYGACRPAFLRNQTIRRGAKIRFCGLF